MGFTKYNCKKILYMRLIINHTNLVTQFGSTKDYKLYFYFRNRGLNYNLIYLKCKRKIYTEYKTIYYISG